MKIFQILNGFVHWDASNTAKSLDIARKMYSPDILFVEAPDYVHEGWGYDETQVGDARFIAPEAPEGWMYDPETGAFYPADESAPIRPKSVEELTAENAALQNTITDLELALCEMYETLISVTGG